MVQTEDHFLLLSRLCDKTFVCMRSTTRPGLLDRVADIATGIDFTYISMSIGIVDFRSPPHIVLCRRKYRQGDRAAGTIP